MALKLQHASLAFYFDESIASERQGSQTSGLGHRSGGKRPAISVRKYWRISNVVGVVFRKCIYHCLVLLVRGCVWLRQLLSRLSAEQQ